MKNKRVVISGIGVLCPIGQNYEHLSSNLKNGKNGISPITQFDTTNFNVKIAGEVNINLEEYFDRKELKRMDRYSCLSLIAAEQAIISSGLNKINSIDKQMVGVIVGSGIGGIKTFEEQHSNLLKSPRRVSPFFIPSMISDIASGLISIKYGFKGPNYSVVSACATGNHSIGDSYRLIKYGDANAIVTGACDATISPISIAGFSNMKALSTNNDYKIASRPFDKNRDGFVMGEGAGILVLEELEHARSRGANIFAEIIGYGATADAFHITTPSNDGEGAVLAMKKAIRDADIEPEKINYINAHGTSTPLNDKIETSAIKRVFKDHAKNISISSTKSMMGHLLGASGAVESIASISAINSSTVPPTINYVSPDPDCDLDYTPNLSKNKKIKYAMTNSFGFGGHNAVLIFKKFKL